MLEADLALGQRLVTLAAEISLEHYRRGVEPKRKADGSEVTVADLEVDARLVEVLRRERPDDAILSEESGNQGAARRRWILDPIDGTSNFVRQKPQWGTHVALELDGEVALGFITRPVLGRAYWALRGGGAHAGPLGAATPDTALHVTATRDLSASSTVFWSSAPDADARRNRLGDGAKLVTPTLDWVLEIGAGRLELAICGGCGPWDLAPGVVIVEEAGGRYSDAHGGRRLDLGEGWYSNGLVHDAALALVGLPAAP